jgi:hypothetical protein
MIKFLYKNRSNKRTASFLLPDWRNAALSFFNASLSPVNSSLILTTDLINLALFANLRVERVSYYYDKDGPTHAQITLIIN